jgi:DNA polymerase III delta prime subunit
MSGKHALWEELYRPQTLDDIILPSKIKLIFSNNNTIQNYVFKGPAGTGKSTLAKILAKQYNALFINASLQNDINSIRTEVDNFCSLQSLDSTKFKVVVFDEADYMSTPSQAALRGVIEKYVHTTRFIFTCNYPDKILPEIMSRLEQIDFNFPDVAEQQEITREYITKIIHIAKINGMTIDKSAVAHIFKQYYPDMRSIIKTLQKLHRQNLVNITLNDVNKVHSLKYEQLFEFICSNTKPDTMYTMLSQYKNNERSIFDAFAKGFVQYCAAKPHLSPKLGDIAIKIHKYTVESKQSIDLFVSLLALSYELSLIVNK